MASAELDHDAAYIEYVTAKTPWLRWVAFLLCQDWHRADDLLQTTAAKLYATWPRASRLENLDGYTRKILVNTFLAEQRSLWWKRVLVHGDRESPDAPAATDAPVAQPDLDAALDLRAALLTLTAKQRTVLILRYYDDLSVSETADTLRCSTGNVKKQTSVALAALRKRLGVADLADPAGRQEPDGSSGPGGPSGPDGPPHQASGARRTSAHAGLDPVIVAQDHWGGRES